MSEKKKFLLRLDESLYAAVETWAGNDLRSVNAQIEVPAHRRIEEGRKAEGTELQQQKREELWSSLFSFLNRHAKERQTPGRVRLTGKA